MNTQERGRPWDGRFECKPGAPQEHRFHQDHSQLGDRNHAPQDQRRFNGTDQLYYLLLTSQKPPQWPSTSWYSWTCSWPTCGSAWPECSPCSPPASLSSPGRAEEGASPNCTTRGTPSPSASSTLWPRWPWSSCNGTTRSARIASPSGSYMIYLLEVKHEW